MVNRITVKLPVDSLLFWKLSGREALSESFALTLTVLGTESRIDSKKLLGQPVTVNIPTQGYNGGRFINGKVTRVAASALELSGTRYAVYQLTVEPDLWPMKLDRNMRIFQSQTVPQIVKTLLSEYQVNVEDKLFASYRVWDYCVQYQESSFDFISRLMELEGIAYHFRHESDRHVMVLSDAAAEYQPFSGYETIPYHQTPSGGAISEEGISQWAREESVTPGIYSLDDYDFRKPYAWLFQARQNPASPKPGSIAVYDWPGRFVEHGHGEYYARIRQERWQVEHQQIQGTATATGIAPGHIFELFNAPFAADNGEYLTLEVNYFFEDNRYTSGSDGETEHRLDFTVIPSSVVFRPASVTAWPKTYGPQTAQVVGPQGESIWTDKYGRVKVKFHWDRQAKGDDTSSCWVRVSSAWAGQGCGGVQVPRVGDEVVIDFINGEPDRPIVTGRVYNEANMPPRPLPASATQMGFMTRSKDGNKDNASYLFFEDRAGSEAVELHSEKDMSVSVENDQTVNVAGNRTTTILKEQHDDITGDASFHYHGSRTTIVDGEESTTFNHGQMETIKFGRKLDIISGGDAVKVKGDRIIRVKGPQTHHVTGQVKEKYDSGVNTTISSGGRREYIHGGLTVDIERGNWSQTVLAGTIHLTSPNMIKLTSLEQIVLDAPEAVFNPKVHSLSVTALSESFVGHSASVTGVSSSIATLALATQGSSIGVRVHEISETLFKKEENGVVINYDVTNVSNHTLKVVNNVLCIFS
ncbi:type VI secretion system tip protein TssI/VgrG [Enterobacter sp. Bisph1]|uniref:type VI secretion system Vgr family protein n=1 Tax=Enterobacter sp. Bisph1 TaxID=1274399 RepID=UPI00057C0D67|nr:type VI secretion system tip protein TssI/VgrG [Enterobacter sp. Bisph1]